MTALSFVFLVLFGLIWAAASAVAAALPVLDLPALEQAGFIVDVGLGWAEAQVGQAFALSVAAYLAAVCGRPALAVLGLMIALLSLAVTGAALDPRIALAMPPEAAAGFAELRAIMPSLRLAGFIGIGLAAAAAAFRREGSLSDAAISGATAIMALICAALVIITPGVDSIALMGIPALLLMLMLALQLAEENPAGGAYAFMAVIVALAGFMMTFVFDGGRIDLRPAFAALPLLLAAELRRAPRIGAGKLWLHAFAVALLIGLGHGQLFDALPLPAPQSFAEIQARIALRDQVALGTGAALFVVTLAGLLAIRLSAASRRGPAPAAQAEPVTKAAPPAPA